MSSVVKYDSQTKIVSKAAVTTGVGGLLMWTVAGLLPFITLPMILVALVLIGGYRILFS